jgi:hypothetical protein
MPQWSLLSRSSTRQFKYKKLDKTPGTIRIVAIRPSQDCEADICCDLYDGVLGSAVYAALSYVRGTSLERKYIKVNGSLFSVTPDLCVALKHIRDPNMYISIWIDAICINHENTYERNAQVKQMAEIYKHATHVFIWTGERIPNLNQAIRLMQKSNDSLCHNPPRIRSVVELASNDNYKDAWEALTVLLRRPWWSRVWIIQEAVYGRKLMVVCGNERFSWELLQVLAESRRLLGKITWTLIKRGKHFNSIGFLHASERLEFICTLRRACPLGIEAMKVLFSGITAAETTDPRDKVFAILGLLKNGNRLCEVDYSKPANQVFLEAAEGLLRQTKSLQFLSWVSNPGLIQDEEDEEGDEGENDFPFVLPSWTPSWKTPDIPMLELQSFGILDLGGKDRGIDHAIELAVDSVEGNKPEYDDAATFFHDVRNRAKFINKDIGAAGWIGWSSLGCILQELQAGRYNANNTIYSASKEASSSSFSCASCSIETGTLRILGAAIDIVDDISPVCSSNFPLDGPPSYWLRTVLNKVLGLPVSSPTADPYDSDDEIEIMTMIHPIFWRLILADQWSGKRLPKGDILEIPGLGRIPPRSVDEVIKIKAAVNSMEHKVAYRWRKFFVSRLTAGLAPAAARVGDVIFVPFGCEVPYLIRRCERGYKLIGEW